MSKSDNSDAKYDKKSQNIQDQDGNMADELKEARESMSDPEFRILIKAVDFSNIVNVNVVHMEKLDKSGMKQVKTIHSKIK